MGGGEKSQRMLDNLALIKNTLVSAANNNIMCAWNKKNRRRRRPDTVERSSLAVFSSAADMYYLYIMILSFWRRSPLSSAHAHAYIRRYAITLYVVGNATAAALVRRGGGRIAIITSQTRVIVSNDYNIHMDNTKGDSV